MEKIGCVIVTYNPSNNFENVLEAVQKQVDSIIVVDNGSKIEVNRYIAGKDNVELIKLRENKGIAYALNRGIEKFIEKKVDWILTLDHDSIITDKMLDKMLAQYKKLDKEIQDKIAMIVPNHVEEKNKEIINEAKLKYEFILTEITSGSLTKTKIYRDERKYEEELFIDLVDHEFCLYLNQHEFKILKVNDAILKHNLGDSKSYKILGRIITPTNHSPIRRYYMSRNRRYIWKKYQSRFPQWVKADKKKFLSENIKILILEKNKKEKIGRVIEGFRDGKKIIGKYKYGENLCKQKK